MRKSRSRMFMTVMALSGALLLLSAAPALAAIKITSVHYDPHPSGPDPSTNAGRNQEYVTIRNTGSHAQRLRGWTLRDLPRAGTPSHVFKFPRFKLGAGATVNVHTGKGSRNSSNLYWGKTFYVWGDDSDRATLKNRAGRTKDTCVWRSANTGGVKFC